MTTHKKYSHRTGQAPWTWALVAAALACAACSDNGASAPADSGQGTDRWFWSPEGIVAHDKYILVANSAHYLEGIEGRWGAGFLTIIHRASRAAVARVPSSAPNPQDVAVCGGKALLLSSGELSQKDGTTSATSGGALDFIDLAGGPPFKRLRSIPLGLNPADRRIGNYGSLLVDAGCKTALIGSGSRGDLFQVDLVNGKVLRGPDNPIVLVPTPADRVSLTVVRKWQDRIAAIDFLSETLCLSDDWSGGLARRTCHSINVQKNQLSGPVDLVRAPDGAALVLMSLANALYRVDVNVTPYKVTGKLTATGLSSNRIKLHKGQAYIVNSLTGNLQQVDPATGKGKGKNPLAVFPTGANPYDMAITAEARGDLAWVTLFKTHEVALVDLTSGKIVGRVGTPGALDAGPGPDLGAGPLDAGPDSRTGDSGASDSGADSGALDSGPAPDGGAKLVGIAKLEKVTYGPGAGFGKAALPGVIQDGPQGGGSTGGSQDVLSLGEKGEAVLSFGPYDVVDGPGVDFIVFENAMLVAPYQPFAEPGIVGLSSKGITSSDFKEFSCDLTRTTGDAAKKQWPYPGCAGVRPVLANVKQNTIPPTSPALAGGDQFDLAALKIKQARYVRIRDAGVSKMGSTSRGFDLDAVVLINYIKAR